MYTYIHIYIYTNTYIYIHTYAYIIIYICVCVCIVIIYSIVEKNMHTLTYVYITQAFGIFTVFVADINTP